MSPSRRALTTPQLRALGGAFVLGVFLLSTPEAKAQSAVDMMEHFFGASNINATSGNGGLSVGISPRGDLSVLTWPSPSYTDQVMHIGSNALDVRERHLMQSHEAMGAFLGVEVVTADGTAFSWLHDEAWTQSQGYAVPDTAIVETVHHHEAWGLEVSVVDYVTMGRDVWTRHVDVTRLSQSPVESLKVIWYSNFAPTLSRVPQLPLADWAFEGYNDYAALYDATEEVVIHFRPEGRGDLSRIGDMILPPSVDYGVVGEALAAGSLDATTTAALVTDIDAQNGPGIYLALGASAPVDGHQVGFDTTPICTLVDELIDNVLALPETFPKVTLPLDPTVVDTLRCDLTIQDLRAEEGWVHTAKDAYTDVTDGDGSLEGSSGAAGRVNEALSVPVTLDAGNGNQGSVTFWVAAGEDAATARDHLTWARQNGHASLLDATSEAWATWLSTARLPSTDDERLLTVCKRALINLKVGTDRETGAIVASISRQAPYGQDWPRDGAFFNVALDLAGYTEMVTQHNRFYLDTIRTRPADPELFINEEAPPDPDDPRVDTFPAWSWEMNYYADGMVGGNIRFEIDNTGLAVWSLVAHVGHLPESERMAYLEEIWPTVKNASDLLARWEDHETGLQALANEDDNYAYTQTLHGAVAVYAGLSNAARAARALGHLQDASRYERRLVELKAAAARHFYNKQEGVFLEGLEETLNPEMAKAGPSGWMIWPARMFPYDDPRVERQIWKNLETCSTGLDPSNSGGAYLTKLLTAAALARPNDPAVQDEVTDSLSAMIHLVATLDTSIVGEVFVPKDSDGDGRPDTFDTRVSNPHLWAGTLIYITAMALHDPALFDAHLEVLPDLQEPSIKGSGGGGCGCSLTSRRLPRPWGVFVILALLSTHAAIRRRQKRLDLPNDSA